MKKVILIFLILALSVSTSLAKSKQAPPDDSTDATRALSDTGIYLGLGTGVDLPGSGWDPNYLLGGGGNLFVGYKRDKNLAVQLDLEQCFFTGTGYSLYQFRSLMEIKYTFDGQGWQPYLLAGPGMVFQALSPSGDSTSNFDAVAGIGAQFDVAPRAHVFIEAKYNFIMSQSATIGDIPISAGLWVGL